MRQTSRWSKMSLWRRNLIEERRMLINVMTLGESLELGDDLAKVVQLGWWQVPTRGFPSQLEELGTFRISDHGGSWIRMMSKRL